MYGSKSRAIIIKSALLIVGCISVLTLTSLLYMWQLNQKVEQISQQHNQKVEILFQMSQIVRDRSFDLFAMYLSDDIWYRDDVFMRFNKRALEFIQLREKLLSRQISDALRAELDNAFEIIRVTQPLQEEIAEYLRAGEQQQVKDKFAEQDLPLELELYQVFDRLIIQASNEMKVAQRELEDRYRTAIIITLIFSILIVLVTVTMMRHSMRKIHANEISISWDAAHDHLTRVYNRRWLNDYLSTRSSDLEANQQHAILYIDLDNFKPINDRFGHSVGDQVLIDTVTMFKKCIRKNDDIVRVGGDEFVILLENCSAGKSMDIATMILDALSEYQLVSGGKKIAGLSCSIGIGFIDQRTDWQQALEFADIECNKVKRHGKNNISVS